MTTKNTVFQGKHLTEDYAKHSGITVRKEFLEIHDVKGHHSGDFECSAQNVIGTISAVVAVQIKCKFHDRLDLEIDQPFTPTH